MGESSRESRAGRLNNGAMSQNCVPFKMSKLSSHPHAVPGRCESSVILQEVVFKIFFRHATRLPFT